MRMRIVVTMRRVIGVWLLCGCVILAACGKAEQPSTQSPQGAATRGDQSALAETAVMMFLLAAKKAQKKSELSADALALQELTKEVAKNSRRTPAKMGPTVSRDAAMEFERTGAEMTTPPP